MISLASILTVVSVLGGFALKVYDRYVAAKEREAHAAVGEAQANEQRTRRLTYADWMAIVLKSVEEEAAAHPELVKKGEAKLNAAIDQFRAKYPEVGALEARAMAMGLLGDEGLGAAAKQAKE